MVASLNGLIGVNVLEIVEMGCKHGHGLAQTQPQVMVDSIAQMTQKKFRFVRLESLALVRHTCFSFQYFLTGAFFSKKHV